MSLNFKYIPLTFLTDESEIKKQICNTIILRYFFDKNNSTVKLNELIEGTQYGYNASALESGNNKFLRISDITNGKVDWETVPFCNCDDEETYLLYSDDILIARTGGTTGKSFLISSPPEHAIYAGYLIRIRANSETKPEFLKLFLDSYVYWSQIVSMNEDEFRPSVNANKLKQLILPKCTPFEQEIAIKISFGEVISGYKDLSIQIDKAINEYENCKRIQKHCLIQKSNSDLLKQSILQEAIQGKLTAAWRKQNPNVEPASELLKRIKAEKAQLIKDKKIRKEKPLPPISEDEIPFELPEGWVWCRIGDISHLITKGSSPKWQGIKYVDEGVLFVTSENVGTNEILLKNKKFVEHKFNNIEPRSILQKGDVLTNIVGASIGRTAIWNEEITANINQAVCLVRFPDSSLNKQYLVNILNSDFGIRLMMDNQFDTGRGNLSLGAISKFKIPFPPLAEQKVIVEKVERLMQKCYALEQEIAQSEQHANMLMQAVLKEAFEGEKKIED